jgi:hypothetical protein
MPKDERFQPKLNRTSPIDRKQKVERTGSPNETACRTDGERGSQQMETIKRQLEKSAFIAALGSTCLHSSEEGGRRSVYLINLEELEASLKQEIRKRRDLRLGRISSDHAQRKMKIRG